LSIQFGETIPTLRMFDIAKADEFYIGFLGFKVDWDARFAPDLPLFRQISRGSLKLHLSEHHGDACPGAHVRVMMTGIEALHAELSGKKYKYYRPSLEKTPWGTLECILADPFGNRIRFCQPA